jgi:membrane associated rhomboid family serine protease
MTQFAFYQPFTGVVRHLIIINALMFFGSYIVFGSESYNTDLHGYSDLGRLMFALYLPGSVNFRPWQIITHMFMHADFGHLLFNMLSLYFFGPPIERVWGTFRFLSYYLICGLGAMALHVGVQWWSLTQAGFDPTAYNVPMLGASGAIFGILVAFAWLFPDQIISLIFPPVSLKAKYFVPIMAALELLYGVRGYSSNVAHFAHLGGALVGFLLILVWYKPFGK